MKIVCEGVETVRQFDEVTRLGTDSCQGFYFAKPMRSSRVDALIRDQAGASNRRFQPAAQRVNATARIGH